MIILVVGVVVEDLVVCAHYKQLQLRLLLLLVLLLGLLLLFRLPAQNLQI